ncbi:MAG: hypothetical protein H6739_13485 [Alphaproteobacteria bacterium]|nr:hypothetical protein [Alphaproteobacteria bacterium]
MRVSRALALALMATLAAPAAWAGQVEDDVKAALGAIQNGDFEGARALLDKAEANAETSDSVVLGTSLASIWFYRGVLEYYDGDRDQKTLEHWRLALLADKNYAFDTSLVAAQEPQDLFEALRIEINSRPHVEPGVDEARSDVRVFVDGNLLKSYNLVVSGRHLVQVLCPDESLHNLWHDFGDAPNYYAVCDGGALTQVEPDEPDEPEKPPKEPRDLNVPRLALWGGGGALLATGVVVNFAVVNPRYDDIVAARDAPATVTRDQADSLTRSFNASRFTTLGLMAAGAACVGAGFFVDADVMVTPLPGGAGLVGRF